MTLIVPELLAPLQLHPIPGLSTKECENFASLTPEQLQDLATITEKDLTIFDRIVITTGALNTDFVNNLRQLIIFFPPFSEETKKRYTLSLLNNPSWNIVEVFQQIPQIRQYCLSPAVLDQYLQGENLAQKTWRCKQLGLVPTESSLQAELTQAQTQLAEQEILIRDLREENARLSAQLQEACRRLPPKKWPLATDRKRALAVEETEEEENQKFARAASCSSVPPHI